MKERLVALAERIDARTLRERVLLFLGIAAAMTWACFQWLLAPVYQGQADFTARLRQQDQEIRSADAEMAAKIAAFQQDPDAAARKRIDSARGQIDQVASTLRDVQRGLVAPDRILPLLQDLLRRQGKLRVVGMRTLPVTGLSEPAPGEAAPPRQDAQAASAPAPTPSAAEMFGKTAAALGAAGAATPAPAASQPSASVPAVPAPKPPEILFRHGVELTLEGSYLDMVAYLSALEHLPTQILWGRAVLNARDPKHARLTLTVYTVSLDKKWIRL
ncbi:MAG: type II secretion system protein GspM [Telluria sp.]